MTASGFRSSLAMGGDLDEVAASLFFGGPSPDTMLMTTDRTDS
ncbi:hypothetical protein BSP_12080 [Brevundimonas sp. Bb-A]|nr:hypothetical protein BSP_12080 [Brevundimonas sp. Bb-A]